MFFGKRKKEEFIVQCPICEWNPDGESHWACTCGHRWNTFDTKGKCPKCSIQWEDTRCPGCGKTTPHKDWYKTKEEIESIENPGNQELRKKKKNLEAKLISYGITNYRVSHLPYLDHSNAIFHSAFEAGCRMIILNTISYLVHNLNDRPQCIEWLQNEKIWNKVSPEEKKFLADPTPPEDLLMDLSWRIEGALVLGWSLNKVKTLPELDKEDNTKQIEELQGNIPGIGDGLLLFLSKLEYRSMEEIYEENRLNELVTTYFRDLMFNGKKDTTKINPAVSFERHLALNWLKTHFEEEDEVTGELWDNTDTST
jgi:hypothetical protein